MHSTVHLEECGNKEQIHLCAGQNSFFLKMKNGTNLNTTAVEKDLSQSFFYTVLVPIFILACLLTFVMNLVIVLAYPFIRNLTKVQNICGST